MSTMKNKRKFEVSLESAELVGIPYVSLQPLIVRVASSMHIQRFDGGDKLYYIRYSDLNRIDHSTILWPRHFRQYMQHAVLDCVLSTYVCTQYKNAKIDNCRPAARALISSKIINQNNYKKKVSRLTPVHAKCTAQSPNPSFSHSHKATSSSSIS